jgi:Domain of unknown function (DUF4282)
MAGQPPEPSFQPAGQDENLTSGRPAWQPAAYPPPPPPGSGGQRAYAAPPPGSGGQQAYAAPSYGTPDQGYAAPDPGYPARDQGYAAPDQGYAAADPGYPAEQAYTSPGQGQGQGYPGYQPGYGAQQGQGDAQGQSAAAPPPQWQGIAGVTTAPKTRQRGEKGFLGSLFDFSFSTFVTPKIIKVLYVLLTLWTVLVGAIFLVIGFREGGFWGGIFTLFIVEPIFVLLTLGVYRVVLEAFMVVFRIYEETKKISENAANRD